MWRPAGVYLGVLSPQSVEGKENISFRRNYMLLIKTCASVACAPPYLYRQKPETNKNYGVFVEYFYFYLAFIEKEGI